MYEVNRNLFNNISIVIQSQPLDPREVPFLSFWCSLIDPIAEEFKNREEGIPVVTSGGIIGCLSGDLVNAPARELRDVLMGLGYTKIQIPVR